MSDTHICNLECRIQAPPAPTEAETDLRELVRCPHCASGKVEDYGSTEARAEGMFGPTPIDCHLCAGTGISKAGRKHLFILSGFALGLHQAARIARKRGDECETAASGNLSESRSETCLGEATALLEVAREIERKAREVERG